MSQMMISFTNANARAATIRNSVARVRRGTLGSRDGRSTIRANRSGQEAFETAQVGLATFGHALAQGSGVINSVAHSFEQLDQVQGRAIQNLVGGIGRSDG